MAALPSSVARCWEKSNLCGITPNGLLFMSAGLVKHVCEINIYRVICIDKYMGVCV